MSATLDEKLIDRNEMPQIASAFLDDMFKYLNRHGVSSKAEKVPAKNLVPMQKVNMAKVVSMAANPRSFDKPVLVDKALKIVDGHHRWAAAKYNDVDIKIIRLNATFERIRDLLNDFEHTTHKDVHEAQIDEKEIDRASMPQVAERNLPDMYRYLAKLGIRTKAERVPARMLTPMQKVKQDWVDRLVKEIEGLSKPILVDIDYNIVDGHHRWAAGKQLDIKVNVMRIMASFDEIRTALAGYDKVEYRPHGVASAETKARFGFKEEKMSRGTVVLESLSPETQNVIRALGSPGRVKIMTGATVVVGQDGQVTLAGLKRCPMTHIVISYAKGKDLFDVVGYKLRGVDLKEVRRVNEVYIGELLRTIEGMTGLAMRL
jgi:hypothetical protein